MKEFKTIGIQITPEQQAVLEVAATKFGLGVGPFMRMAALQMAQTMNLHYQQPQAD